MPEQPPNNGVQRPQLSDGMLLTAFALLILMNGADEAHRALSLGANVVFCCCCCCGAAVCAYAYVRCSEQAYVASQPRQSYLIRALLLPTMLLFGVGAIQFLVRALTGGMQEYLYRAQQAALLWLAVAYFLYRRRFGRSNATDYG